MTGQSSIGIWRRPKAGGKAIRVIGWITHESPDPRAEHRAYMRGGVHADAFDQYEDCPPEEQARLETAYRAYRDEPRTRNVVWGY